MFGQLNGSALRTLRFRGLRLWEDDGGSWADALDILRDTLACRGDNVLDPDVRLGNLYGGELDALYSSPRKWHRDLDTLSDLENEDGEIEYSPWTDEEVSDVANAFVLGYIEVNPLR
ncbi:hypothetical protein PG997_013217 [Apiospora hydei]|uniref:Uncharacterized protein n=1 Tax=Apiospora hydei TaxID=1337664 RepID=A0ABR1V874_9PEZI